MVRSFFISCVSVIFLNCSVSAAFAIPTDEPPPPSSNQNPVGLPDGQAVPPSGQNIAGQVTALQIGSEPAVAAPIAQGKQVIATTDSDWPDVSADILELKRTGGDTLTLKFAINNASSEDVGFDYNFGDGRTDDYATIGGTNLLDPANKKKYLVVRDSNGSCICSNKQKSITPGAKRNMWAKFPAPPINVTKITVQIPHFIPADDVPIN